MDNIQLDIHTEKCMDKLGRFLLENSNNKGINDIAIEVGVTNHIISKICSGQVVSLKIFLKILNWAGIDFDSILELKGKK